MLWPVSDTRPTRLTLVPIETFYKGAQKPGDLAFESNGSISLCCPQCGRLGVFDSESHQATFEDKQITITPSLVCPRVCGAHFNVVRSEIRWC